MANILACVQGCIQVYDPLFTTFGDSGHSHRLIQIVKLILEIPFFSQFSHTKTKKPSVFFVTIKRFVSFITACLAGVARRKVGGKRADPIAAGEELVKVEKKIFITVIFVPTSNFQEF